MCVLIWGDNKLYIQTNNNNNDDDDGQQQAVLVFAG